MKIPLLAVVIAVLMSLSNALQAADSTPPAADSWTGTDKSRHFGVSLALGAASRGVLPNHPWMALGVAVAPGLIKEFTDRRFSRKDLTMDVAGALVGVYVSGCYASFNQIVCGFKF